MKKFLIMLRSDLVLIAGVVVIVTGCGTLFQRHEERLPTLSTNALSGVVTTNYSTNVFYLVNPGVTNALAKGEELTGHVPVWGPIASGGIAAVMGLLTFIAKKKSDQAALVPALIAGIEKAPDNQAVKQSIQAEAIASGVQERLHAEVRKLT